MKKILVSGLINIETSLKVDHFPIEYCPIEYPFFGVDTFVSGVGYNVAKALKTLDSDVDLLSIIGDDILGNIIAEEIKRNNIDINHLIKNKKSKTATSVVLVDNNGKRKIYCDLKDLQDVTPLNGSHINIDNYSLAILTNINFNRELIKLANKKNIKVACDVHVLSSINDSYNDDFMKYSNILFLSNEAIIGREEEFIKEIYDKYHNEIIVCGCGDRGALMYIGKENRFVFESAKAPLGIKSTIGAGDALFSCFIHYYVKELPLEECLKKATLFAGIKISELGGSNGFVNEKELEKYNI